MAVANKVIRDEYDYSDKSTRVSIKMGLRTIRNDICKQAIEHLEVVSQQNDK